VNPLDEVRAAIAPPDAEAMSAARERQDRMTKHARATSLGNRGAVV